MTKTDARPRLTQQPAWQALERHYAEIKDVQLRELFAADPAARRAADRRGRGPVSGLLQEPRDRRNAEAALATRRADRRGREARRHVRGREDQRDREPRRAAHRPARAQGRHGDGGRNKCGAGGPRGAGQDGGLRRSGSRRDLAGLHRQADQEHRQHRHRRLRPRPGDGLRGAEVLQPARPHGALRVQRGRHRPGRENPRPRPCRDAVYRVQQDLHHPGNDGERDQRPRLAAQGAQGRRGGGAAFRGRFDQRGGGGQVRHRHRQHVRLLGLGGRALQHGQRHRPVADDRHRP